MKTVQLSQTDIMKNWIILFLLSIYVCVLFSERVVGQSDQTLRYSEENALGNINPYNLSKKRDVDSRFYSLIYEGLYRYNFDTREYESVLIESENRTNDGWNIFKLIDAKWHDGTPLSSSDIEFTINYIEKYDKNEIRRNRIRDKIDNFEIISDKEFRIKFDSSVKTFQPELNFWILPEHKLDGTERDRQEFLRSPVGTGPYKLDRKTLRGKIFLIRFEDYHSKLPETEAIELDRVADTSSRIDFLLRNQSDMLVEVPYDRLNDIESRLTHKIEAYQSVSIHTIAFNFDNDLFQDLRLRRAMALGFNRKSALSQWYNDQGQLIASPYSRTSSLIDPNVEPLPYDLDEAKRLLAESGYSDNDDDGYLESPEGNILEFNLISKKSIGATNQPKQNVVKDFIQNMEEIGIKINNASQEGDFFSEVVFYDRDFDLSLIEWTLDPNYDIRPLFHSNNIRRGGNNIGGYQNSQIDDLLEQLYEGEGSYSQRSRIASQIQDKLAEEVPHIFMYNVEKNAAIDLRFTNVIIDPIYFFSYINEWQISDD